MEVKDIFLDVLEKVEKFRQENPNGVVIIRGPTATGKTDLSIMLAEKIPAKIISADSRQIYKYMDIGTDKVSQSIREKIPHYQIDIVEPDQLYTA
jgi:tRNA dimethylallyltransferase